MPIKLSMNKIFTPDILIYDQESGKLMKNNEYAEPIRVEYKLATVDQKNNRYQHTVSSMIDGKPKTEIITDIAGAVLDLTVKVFGLETYGIVDGKTLVEFQPTPETNDLIEAIYHRVMGNYGRGDGEKSMEDITPGESPASE